MSKEMEYKMVPKLRFPEFQADGEWEEKRLEEVATLSKGKGVSKSDITPRGALPCIRYGELYTHYGETINSIISYTNVPPTDLVISQANDVIIPASGETKEDIATASCVLQSGVALGGDLNIIRSKLNGVFLSYYLNNVKKQEIAQLAQGISVVHLYPGQLKKLNINAPKPKEQQKIADCLSSLDDLITTQNQKLEALKTHKKGLMQQLFPAEGETVPRLRFLEFRDAGDWVDTSVEENCLVKGRIGYRGYTTEDLVEKDKGALVLGGKNIQNQVIDLSEPTFLSWGKYFESPEIMVNVGDIIFSQRGTLGDCAIIEKEIGPATINPSMVVLKNITCNPKFLYYILIGGSIQKEVQKNKALGAIPMLSQKQIKEFTFLVPDNPSEQQRIADTLSSLDDLIAARSQKIEALKTHKKGLMQQLFPNPNETEE